MIDESFHLTPLDVRRMDFGKATFGGYDRAKVDDFRNQVADELERLLRMHQELDGKARGFHEQLRTFRDRDKALNDALISAQQLRSEMRQQAERETELIIREARAEGERLLDAARSEIRRLEQDIAGLERARLVFIGQVRALVERQLAELAAMERPAPERPSAERPAPVQPPTGAEYADGGGRDTIQTPTWLESLVKE